MFAELYVKVRLKVGYNGLSSREKWKREIGRGERERGREREGDREREREGGRERGREREREKERESEGEREREGGIENADRNW